MLATNDLDDINAKYAYGREPLHLAAGEGDIDRILVCLRRGADPDEPDGVVGQSPMHWAATANHPAAMQCLLEHGADLEAVDDPGFSVAQWAAMGGSLEALQWLYGRSVDLMHPHDGLTLMYLAPTGGNLRVLQWLVEIGHSVSARNDRGEYVVCGAVEMGQQEILEWLYEQGADLHVRVPDGRTLMHYAVCALNKDVGMLSWLASHGLAPDARDCNGQTPLHHISVSDEKAAFVPWLVEHGADINSRDDAGQTPLHRAVARISRGQEVLNAMFRCGADLHARDRNGRTPLDLVEHLPGCRPTVQWLVEHGARPARQLTLF